MKTLDVVRVVSEELGGVGDDREVGEQLTGKADLLHLVVFVVVVVVAGDAVVADRRNVGQLERARRDHRRPPARAQVDKCGGEHQAHKRAEHRTEQYKFLQFLIILTSMSVLGIECAILLTE